MLLRWGNLVYVVGINHPQILIISNSSIIMPQQTTMWRFLKRDSSAVTGENGMETSDFLSPTPKRAKNSTPINNDIIYSPPNRMDDLFAPFYTPSSVHTSSRTLASPTVSKMDCDDSQMILDCGQKRFGPEICPECKMIYTPVDGNDAAMHERYHREIMSAPRINRRLLTTGIFICVQEFEDGFIYKCCFDNESVRQNRNNCQLLMEEMCERMSADLGASISQRSGSFEKAGRQMYVFIHRSNDLAIHGILVVDHVKFGYAYNADNYLDQQPSGANPTKPSNAAMGVHRIWAWSGARRRRIATRLLDCARYNFIFGVPILKKHVAFSDPTTNGLEFAKHYCGTGTILVYPC